MLLIRHYQIYSVLLVNIMAFIIQVTPIWAKDDNKILEIIANAKRKKSQEQTEAPPALQFHGMIYMMGWVGKNTNYGFIYDNDSFLGMTYSFSKNSKVVIDLKIADILKPSNLWADTQIYGQVDILEHLGISDYGLIVKLGKFNKKNEYFGEYAMGIGKDYIADKKSNLDMLNWQLAFLLNNTRFPFEINITSDFDFGHRPAKTARDFSDWNDKGLSVMTEAKVTRMPVYKYLLYTASLFYDEQFFVNEKNGNYIGENTDTLDPKNRSTYIGGSHRFILDTQPMSWSIGSSMKSFSIKKEGFNKSTDPNGNEILTPYKNHKKGIDFDIGVWGGNYSFMDFRVAYHQTYEDKANTQKTIGIETNIYMIPKISIYGGIAIALEKTLINFGEHLTTTRSFYGWDIGIIYTPVMGVLLTTGWQKMVRWDDYGYFYVKATFWW